MTVHPYVRVSTRDQTTDTQEAELREWAARRGWEVGQIYRDVASGTRSDREAMTRLLQDAHAGRVKAVVIWSLDRLTREGIAATFRYLDRLKAAGCQVRSLREEWVDTDSPTWPLIVSVLAWVAEQEHRRIGERTRAGQARFRRAGGRLGRPVRGFERKQTGRSIVDPREVGQLRGEGVSWPEISRRLDAPVSTCMRRLRVWMSGALSWPVALSISGGGERRPESPENPPEQSELP